MTMSELAEMQAGDDQIAKMFGKDSLNDCQKPRAAHRAERMIMTYHSDGSDVKPYGDEQEPDSFTMKLEKTAKRSLVLAGIHLFAWLAWQFGDMSLRLALPIMTVTAIGAIVTALKIWR